MTLKPILLLTSRPNQLKTFVNALDQDKETVITTVESIQDAVDTVEKSTPILTIVDNQVLGVTGLDIIRHLIKVNAFIQTAAISELDDRKFHEQSEGLGILYRLPLIPDEDDVRKLLRQLEQVATNLI